MSSCNGINHNNLLLNRHWLILRLFQYLLDTFTLCQVLQCIRIQIGTELCEGLQLSELSKLCTDRTGNLLHCLDLRITTNSADRKSGIDRWSET